MRKSFRAEVTSLCLFCYTGAKQQERGIHMNVIYHFQPTAPYSLHDMRVNRIERTGENLRFCFETGYVELKGENRQVSGDLLIERVSMAFSDVYFLSENGAYGTFQGQRMELESFLDRYRDISFEILDEAYGCHTVTYRGYLSLPDREPLIEVMLSLYYTGNIVYEVQE